MHNDQDEIATKILRSYVPIAADTAATMLRLCGELSMRKMVDVCVEQEFAYLRLITDVDRNGRQRVALALAPHAPELTPVEIASAGGEAETIDDAWVASRDWFIQALASWHFICKLDAMADEPAAEPPAPKNRRELRDQFVRAMVPYLGVASLTAAETLLQVERSESVLYEAADALHAAGYALLRLTLDYLPEGPLLRLWAVPRPDIDGDPVQLAVLADYALMPEKTKPTEEQKKRAAWLLNTMPKRH